MFVTLKDCISLQTLAMSPPAGAGGGEAGREPVLVTDEPCEAGGWCRSDPLMDGSCSRQTPVTGIRPWPADGEHQSQTNSALAAGNTSHAILCHSPAVTQPAVSRARL